MLASGESRWKPVQRPVLPTDDQRTGAFMVVGSGGEGGYGRQKQHNQLRQSSWNWPSVVWQAPWPGIEPTAPAVEGEVLTPGLPGKSLHWFSKSPCKIRRDRKNSPHVWDGVSRSGKVESLLQDHTAESVLGIQTSAWSSEHGCLVRDTFWVSDANPPWHNSGV